MKKWVTVLVACGMPWAEGRAQEESPISALTDCIPGLNGCPDPQPRPSLTPAEPPVLMGPIIVEPYMAWRS